MVIWLLFIIFIIGLLALDLGVFHKKAHVISTHEALAWTTFWIILAFVFNIGIYYFYEHHWFGLGKAIGFELTGKQAALQFLTGYIIEKSLSLDNIFVIALIFSYFNIPLMYQHRVLFWGVLGALIMRGIMIAIGATLINRFDWIIFVFGGFLIFTAIKMLIVRHDNLEPNKNPLVKLVRRLFPVTDDFQAEHFFTYRNGKRAITPLFIVLIVVESSDVLFAVDSIPAIFAITRDPFLVFTSNVFAILGLRSLYFALASLLEKFRYLKMSLVFVLAFVGVKMVMSHQYHIPTPVSLAVIIGLLGIGILASIFASHRDTAPLISPIAREIEDLALTSWKQARRITILILGSSVLVIGIAMIILPGPAFLVIPAGLAILATEFLWAKKILKKVKDNMQKIYGKTSNRHPDIT